MAAAQEPDLWLVRACGAPGLWATAGKHACVRAGLTAFCCARLPRWHSSAWGSTVCTRAGLCLPGVPGQRAHTLHRFTLVHDISVPAVSGVSQEDEPQCPVIAEYRPHALRADTVRVWREDAVPLPLIVLTSLAVDATKMDFGFA